MGSARDTTDLASTLLDIVRLCERGIRPAELTAAAMADADDVRASLAGLEASGQVRHEDGRIWPGPTRSKLAPDAEAALHVRIADAITSATYDPAEARFGRAWHLHRAGDEVAAAAAWRLVVDAPAATVPAGMLAEACEALDSIEPIDTAPRMEAWAGALAELGAPGAAAMWGRAAATWGAAGSASDATRCTIAQVWADAEPEDGRAGLVACAADTSGGAWSRYAGALVFVLDGDWGGAVAPLEAALATARGEGDATLEIAILSTLATARSNLGSPGVAVDLLRTCLRLAEHVRDETTRRRIRHNLVETLVEDLQVPAALREAEAYRRDVQQNGPRAMLPGAMAAHARMLGFVGHPLHMRTLAEAAHQADRELDPSGRDVFAGLVLAESLALGGMSQRLEHLLTQLEERCTRFGFASYLVACTELRIRALLLSGETDAAQQLLARIEPDDPGTWGTLAVSVARAAATRPDDAGLVEWVRRLVAPVAEVGVPVVQLQVREAQATLAALEALGLDDTGDAGHPLTEVVAAWREAGRPLDAALALRSEAMTTPGGDLALLGRAAAQLEGAGLVALARHSLELLAAEDQPMPAATIPLLANLVPRERARVLDRIEQRDLPASNAGDVTTLEPGIWLIARGELRLVRNEPGVTNRGMTVAVLGPGDTFTPDLGDDLATQVQVATDAVAWLLPQDQLDAVLAQAPGFGAALVAEATARLSEARLLAGESALLPVDARLARTLVRLGERFGRPSLQGELLIDAQLTQADLASMIGSQRTRVSELVSRLQDDGLIGSWKRRIVVFDLAALRERARLNEQ